ncbi:MAG: hypothetical protein CL477_18735 [Acidobacteria bacterium]|jgi:hypothetical protein|nr:hypothetical protein [Acidobacteriota bacterium]MDP7480192.1 DUF1552 domain-containing protein [Vicinamibacterales bacterium]HJN45663.1 DUF1552 domain-containing protein [Vicinamibacterales bacterium]
MIISKQAISRRTVLRGVGATLALPLLDRMLPASTALARAAAAPVTRFCTVYVPNSIVMDRWTPTTEGTGFEFTPTLKALEPFRDHLLVLSGLDNTGARSRSGASGAHAKPAGAFMTGIEPLPTTGSSSLQLGISMDQIVANTLGQETPLPSLELGLEGADTVNGVGTCDVGFSCAYQNRLAWGGPSTPLPVGTNPRVVFDRLFGNIDSTDPDVRRARLHRQGSIIDSVLDKVDRLQGGLGQRDRAKLDEYLQSVREIERRLQNAEAQGRELPLVESPAGIPVSYDEHARLMFDMQALALQTDTTRVITFQIGREQSGATYPQIGVSDSHHPISHHGGDKNKIASLAKINAYHTTLFTYFLEKLATTRDGDARLLDNVITLYGSAISEGNSHDIRNLPILLAGGGSGLVKGGRHVKYPDQTQRLTNLQLTLLNKLGIPTEAFGDSTGEQLQELAGV